MNKENLLKAIGNIDDKYIEATEEKRDTIAPKSKTATGLTKSDINRKINFRFGPWVKGLAAVAASFIVILGIGASGWLLGGAGKSAPMEAADTEYLYSDARIIEDSFDNGLKYDNTVVNESFSATDLSKQKETEGVFEPYEKPREQKLVYNAFLYLQTENYNKSFEALKNLVSDLDGYFESQSESNGNYYSSTSKSGYCTVRIPTTNYKTFMDAIGQSWHVVNKDESISDISEQYYETQDRLETLKIKEDRLHELLKDANNLSDIITLEDQLSNTEYQIEQLTNEIKGYDKQVDYSTINISLDEVTQMGNTVGSEGFGKRLVRAIKNGFRNFGEGIADLIVWIGYNVIEIIIAAVVIILIWKFHLIRKIINWIKR